MSPLITALILATVGLWILVRAARRYLRDEARYASQPREMRMSILSGVILGTLLLVLAGLCLAMHAGLSRYRPLDGPGPFTLVLSFEPANGGFRITSPGVALASGMRSVEVEKGWFSLVARKVVWRGPMRWAGFRDAMRPCALLSAQDRGDIAKPGRVRRLTLSPDNLFDGVLAGPASVLGLWASSEIRTPWRPTRDGLTECFFTEAVTAPVPPP